MLPKYVVDVGKCSFYYLLNMVSIIFTLLSIQINYMAGMVANLKTLPPPLLSDKTLGEECQNSTYSNFELNLHKTGHVD